jgi:hypothetical protein
VWTAGLSSFARGLVLDYAPFALLKKREPHSPLSDHPWARQGGTNKKYFEFGLTFTLFSL